MSYYVIAVGGTGNKILESVVYAACADAFQLPDSQNTIPSIHLLSVDVDAACGNTTRAKQAALSYQKVQQAMQDSQYDHYCFHTAVDLEQWSINLSKRTASVEKMSQNHASDQVLAHVLFTEAESALEYNEGFLGHPDLGVLFFSDILDNLEQMSEQSYKDEFQSMLHSIDDELNHDEDVHLILCGSIFGGTGASGIPAIAKYLQKRYLHFRNHFIMGAVLLLPYYQVPAAKKENEQEITVESDTFLDKARTALQYYGMENMMRDNADDNKGLFDALYLLGLPPEQFIKMKTYSTGSDTQENDAHLLEWIAARCIAHFMKHTFRGKEQNMIDCYYYQMNQKQLSWRCFDSDAAEYCVHYGALLKSSLVYCTECYDPLIEWVRNRNQKAIRVNYCAANFSDIRLMTAKQRADLEETLQALYRFYSFYINWFSQIMDNLPPVFHEKNQKNKMVNSNVLFQLREYLRESGLKQKNKVFLDGLSGNLQREFQNFLFLPVKDTQSWSKCISQLGNISSPAQPQQCFSQFLSALLESTLDM